MVIISFMVIYATFLLKAKICSWYFLLWYKMLFSIYITTNPEWQRKMLYVVILISKHKIYQVYFKSKRHKVNPRINTMEETFKSHLINATIFKTKSFNFLSEFTLLFSCATCLANSAVLLCESEKVSQQKKENIISSK